MSKPKLNAKDLPLEDFKSRTLDLVPFTGSQIFRAFQTRHPDPLGFVPGKSRFSDPRIRPDPTHNPPDVFVTIYFGTDVETCVLETIIRDSGIGTPGPDTPVSKSYMRSWSIAKVECSAPLQLIDLRADGCIKNKIPTDAVRSKNHVVGQIWAHAIHEHPQRPDGIIFSSRLNEGGNIALFGRAMGKMYATSHAPLFDYRSELAAILTTYKIALT